MEVAATAIPDVKVLTPKKFGDHRGFFSETYNAADLAAAGVPPLVFVQDNDSLSVARGVLRGEAKRLRVDALLLTEDRAAALSLLEGLTLSSGARDVELALIRGELLAARGDCQRALVDFDRVTATTAASALRRRAQTGRNDCEVRLGQPATAPP